MKIAKDTLAQFKKSSPCQGTCEWPGMNTSVIKHWDLVPFWPLTLQAPDSRPQTPDSKQSYGENLYENNMSLC